MLEWLAYLNGVCFDREIARMLADEHMKRVIIVDTSNEIGGDGDVLIQELAGQGECKCPMSICNIT